MRKIITIIFFTLCWLSASAQYTIYSVNGDVKIKRVASSWINARKGAELSLHDSICIANNARLQLLVKQTSQIFESTGSGVFTTLRLISDARKQSGRVIAELNKEMYQNARADYNRQSSFVGASTRGDEELFTDSLYAYLLSDFAEGEPLPNGLCVKTIRKKNTFCLSIENMSDNGFYINLLIRNNQTGERTCAYVTDSYEQPCIYITPNASLTLDQLMFVPSKDCEYIVWATERPFDSNHLHNLLSTSAPANNTNSKGIKVFSKKIIP